SNLKRLFVLLFCCVMVPTVWAQEFSLSGRVTDAANRAISGASVQVKGKNASTLTGESGTFSLSLNVGDILQVSYVGYTPEELTLVDHDPVTFILMAAHNDLYAVVVSGSDTAPKRYLTGVGRCVKGRELREAPVTTAVQGLTGNVAGVNVVTQRCTRG